jgi:hypothetical protein
MANLRPQDLLDEWKRFVGLDKRDKKAGIPTVYGRYEMYDPEAGSFRVRWTPLAADEHGDEPLDTIRDAYLEGVKLLKQDFAEGRSGRDTRFISALCLLVYGEGALAPDPTVLAEKGRDNLDPEMLALSDMGFVPTEVVNLISPEGYIVSTKMYYPDRAPFVDTHEMYVPADTGEPETYGRDGHPEGTIVDAMATAFTILMLLTNTVEQGREPDIANLARTTQNYTENEIGADIHEQLLAFLRETAGKGKSELEKIREVLKEIDGDNLGD